MAGNAPHENIGHANDRTALSPFESAPKTPESMSFATIMANEVQKGQCALLHSTPMEMSSGKAGNEHLDLGKWSPANECSASKNSESTQAADARIGNAIDGTQPAPLKLVGNSDLDMSKQYPQLDTASQTKDIDWRMTA